MDHHPSSMSQNPAWDLPVHALAVASWAPGGSQAMPDGLRHVKTAPATIVAVVEAGSYTVARPDGSSATAKAGEAFLAQEGDQLDIVHHGPRRGAPLAACWTHFRITLFGSQDACRLLDLPPVLPAAAAAEVRAHIRATWPSPASGLAGAARCAEAGLATLRILSGIAPPSASGRLLFARAADLAPLAAWVQARLGETIRLDDLAVAAGLSKSRLHARFQADLGMAPLAWVREQRLQAARDRLLATSEPVAAIGSACGFPDQFHFSRAVRRRFGLAPSVLRSRGGMQEA
jgi:AraC-like DNA-binding protein